VLYIPDETAAHMIKTTPRSNENSVVCVSVTAASPQKLIITPTQHIGLIISFKNIRVSSNVNIGAEAMMKLLTPADTLTEPVLNRYEYSNTPEMPLAANIGKSFSLGSLIFFNKPIMISVIDAIEKRSTISDTGL
jgi:hypothetical protein